jgi:hypothetical protein
VIRGVAGSFSGHSVESVGDVREARLPARCSVAEGVSLRTQLERLGGVARSG